jgi:hypothetical protein
MICLLLDLFRASIWVVDYGSFQSLYKRVLEAGHIPLVFRGLSVDYPLSSRTESVTGTEPALILGCP